MHHRLGTRPNDSRFASLPALVAGLSLAVACAEDTRDVVVDSGGGTAGTADWAGSGGDGSGGTTAGGAAGGAGAGGSTSGSAGMSSAAGASASAGSGGSESDVGAAQGESCQQDSECAEGLFCADQVCCNTECEAACQACNVSGSVGQCVAEGPVPSVPSFVSPFRGAYSGSLHAPAAARTLRPSFEWTAAEAPDCGPVRYQLQLDDSCEPGALASCEFASPELEEETAEPSFQPAADLPVSETAPVGAAYAARVRACLDNGACSPYSEPTYLHVGRTLQDINGDGFADVLVRLQATGSPVDVYLGGVSFDSQADGRFELFGSTDLRHAGDLNGDGFGDLVSVSNDFEVCSSAGPFPVVVFGGDDALSLATQPICGVAGSPSVAFGIGAAGDLDGDGFADLAMAREFQDARFLVIRGGAAVQSVPEVDLDIAIAGSEGTYAHSSLERAFDGQGDFNRDGYADVVITGRGVNPAALHTRVLLGGATLTSTASAPIVLSGNSNSLVTRLGDLNDDGHDDWAVTSDPSTLSLLYGGASVPAAFDSNLDTEEAVTGASRLTDFDRDGVPELFVPTDVGVLLFREGSGLTALGGGQISANERISSADHNGDGRDDLLLQSSGSTAFSVRWAPASTNFSVVPIGLTPAEEEPADAPRSIVY